VVEFRFYRKLVEQNEEFCKQEAETPVIKEPSHLYLVPQQIPYYEDIPAGDSWRVEPETHLRIEVPHESVEPGWYALRVNGDSMEPNYKTGDIVLIDGNQHEPRNGRVVVALIDGAETTLKLYYRRGDEIELRPINTDAHKSKTYHADRVKVQGVLIEIIKTGKEG
jgi:repressor LexA